ncbi:respiratory nitrate reductase subunit gamma [bacterium]|nr:respiratory nitrate reductase subunit gamma [bacterium]
MTVLHGIVYVSAIIFIIAVAARMVRTAKMPVHLRWELYPVPHEKGRASYGGSMLEEVDWWTKPQHKDEVSTMLFMIPEILLLKGVWEHNRSLWFPSWALHFGLYLLIGDLGLLILGGILAAFGVTGGIIGLIAVVTTALAWAGTILGVVGAVLMLLRRLTDKNLKMFNSFSHFFNLLLIGGMCLTELVWVATDPAYAYTAMGIFTGWVTGSSIPALSAMVYWHIGLVLVFMVYFPFTHMTHAFIKYFTWHSVRWEDTPNTPGSELSKKIGEMVSQKPTWAAPHVNADGKKTWIDLVGETGAPQKREEVKK